MSKCVPDAIPPQQGIGAPAARHTRLDAARYRIWTDEARVAAKLCPDPVLRRLLYELADAFQALAGDPSRPAAAETPAPARRNLQVNS